MIKEQQTKLIDVLEQCLKRLEFIQNHSEKDETLGYYSGPQIEAAKDALNMLHLLPKSELDFTDLE